MSDITRRQFHRGAGAATVLLAAGAAPAVQAQAPGRVVIVGGGAGGATVAHHVKKQAPELEVTLVEVQPRYTTCFFSNLYIGGFRSFESITHGYEGLASLGVNVVHEWASDVDTDKRIVRLENDDTLAYDKLVLSPGIDIKYDSIEGYSPEASELMPHAWKAGEQTRILRRQLMDMPDGGVVVLAPPPNPYRCPPGPYERASMIAHYLKYHKPYSKLIILDGKNKFSKQPLFTEAWQMHYDGLVEVRLTNEVVNNQVVRVDANRKEVVTAEGDLVKADVANIIPAQRAGQIAHLAGCADGDWCPIDPASFASRRMEDVYVLGDASIAASMPKSAFSANSQAKTVVNDIVAELAGKKRFPPRYRNTCWSLLSTGNSVKVGASYTAGEDSVEVTSKFISKPGEDEALRAQTYEESLGWYAGITADMFAKG